MMKLFFVFLIITVNAQQRFAPIGRAENPPTQVNASNLEPNPKQASLSGNFGRNCGEDCSFCSQRKCCRDRECIDCRGRDCCRSRNCPPNENRCGRFEQPVWSSDGRIKCIPRQQSCINTPFFVNQNCAVSPCFEFEKRCRSARVCFPDPCRPCKPRYYNNQWDEVCR